MRKVRYTGGAIVSCAVCGKYPNYNEEMLQIALEELEGLKDSSCPPHKMIMAEPLEGAFEERACEYCRSIGWTEPS